MVVLAIRAPCVVAQVAREKPIMMGKVPIQQIHLVELFVASRKGDRCGGADASRLARERWSK
jgi:hypothetical protein